jgi:hypothetical protein
MPTTDPTPPDANAPDELARRVLANVAKELAADQKRQAARHYLAGVGHESMPPEIGKVAWVRSVIGQEATKSLVSALAGAPCFGCKLGYQECQSCGGSGFTAEARVCRTCLGFGQSRCEFCSGSGLTTYNALPEDFRPQVMTRRVARAVALIDRLRGEAAAATTGELPMPVAAPVLPPAPAATSDEAGQRQRVLQLNKLLGVLENAVIAARTLIRAGRAEQATFAPMAKRIALSAAVAEQQLRESLRRLAAWYRVAPAGGAEESELDRGDREAKSAFYEEVAGSSFFQATGLEHFFLHPHAHGATARIQEQAAAAAAAADPAAAERDAVGDDSEGSSPADAPRPTTPSDDTVDEQQ